jgi:hypothetical protein
MKKWKSEGGEKELPTEKANKGDPYTTLYMTFLDTVCLKVQSDSLATEREDPR